MIGFGGIEVIVFEDVEEGEKTAVDPSSTLFHEIGMCFHGICSGTCIGYIF